MTAMSTTDDSLRRRHDDSATAGGDVCRFHSQSFQYLGDLTSERFKSLELLVEAKFDLLAERIIPIPDSLQKACLDITWVKRIGYVSLLFCLSLAATGWSLVIPFAASINTRLSVVETAIQVNSRQLATMEGTDSESKVDRKHLHDEQLSHRRNHVPAISNTLDQGKR